MTGYDQWINLGVDGETSRYVLSTMTQVLMYKPEKVIVIVGTNDVKGLYEAESFANITKICNILDAYGIPSIWANVHAYEGSVEYGVPAMTPDQVARVASLNSFMSSTIPSANRTLKDFESWALSHLELIPDSCHPSTPEGYQALGQFVWS